MGKRVLVAATGSVATVKVPMLASELIDRGCEVRVVMSETARHFLSREDLAVVLREARERCGQAGEEEGVYLEEDEWKTWQKMGDPVLHIELGKWADVLVIAPLSANTLAKLANGLCDNLTTSVARAWDYSKPVLAAPAMNTRMWTHPVTAEHVGTLSSRDGIKFVDPVVKTLACKDVGLGAMAPYEAIAEAALELTK